MERFGGGIREGENPLGQIGFGPGGSAEARQALPKRPASLTVLL
jgi:hypothetical protein